MVALLVFSHRRGGELWFFPTFWRPRSHLDGPTLMTPLKCNYSPRPPPQIPSHWVLGLQHMNIPFGAAHSVPNNQTVNSFWLCESWSLCSSSSVLLSSCKSHLRPYGYRWASLSSNKALCRDTQIYILFNFYFTKYCIPFLFLSLKNVKHILSSLKKLTAASQGEPTGQKLLTLVPGDFGLSRWKEPWSLSHQMEENWQQTRNIYLIFFM